MDGSRLVEKLKASCAGMTPEALFNHLINKEFSGKIAMVSSFGIESAVMLDLAARANPHLPVIFLETRKLFPETLDYVETLTRQLGLTNVQAIYPDYAAMQRDDPDGTLWETNANSCCYIRKVEPLHRALQGYGAWFTGRKRFHGGLRGELPVFEAEEGRIKINPLALWAPEDIRCAFIDRGLPAHPLAAKGYTSVGCAPCTHLPSDPADPRSGRWKGQDKEECGIHLGPDGKFQRTSA